MRFDEMTDQEINREVASYFYCENWLSRHAEMLGMIPDYCNDQSDVWPIIVSNKICIQWYEDNHGIYASASMATSDESNDSFISDDENPLRAACICFLKMKDAEK